MRLINCYLHHSFHQMQILCQRPVTLQTKTLGQNPIKVSQVQLSVDGSIQSFFITKNADGSPNLTESVSVISSLMNINQVPYAQHSQNQQILLLDQNKQNDKFMQLYGAQILQTHTLIYQNHTLSFKQGDKSVYLDNQLLQSFPDPIFQIANISTCDCNDYFIVLTCNKYKNGYYGARSETEVATIYLVDVKQNIIDNILNRNKIGQQSISESLNLVSTQHKESVQAIDANEEQYLSKSVKIDQQPQFLTSNVMNSQFIQDQLQQAADNINSNQKLESSTIMTEKQSIQSQNQTPQFQQQKVAFKDSASLYKQEIQNMSQKASSQGNQNVKEKQQLLFDIFIENCNKNNYQVLQPIVELYKALNEEQ